MNPFAFRRTSLLLSLATLTVALSGLAAQAEAIGLAPTNVEMASTKDLEVAVARINSDQALQQHQIDVAGSVAIDVEANALSESVPHEPGLQFTNLPNLTASVDPGKAHPNSSIQQQDEFDNPELAAITFDGSAETQPDDALTSTAGAESLAQFPETTTPRTTTPTDIPPPTPGTITPPLEPVAPGRTTRAGRSYVGIGGNFGLTGNTALGGENDLSLFSKLGLTRNVSLRPAATIDFDNNATVLAPLTVDFPIQRPGVVGGLPLAPYVGGGAAISVGSNNNVGPLLTGGIDIPVSRQLTATTGINVGFLDKTDVGLLLGVGYNF